MKLLKSLKNPTKIISSLKKSRSVSKSTPTSFTNLSYSSSSDSSSAGKSVRSAPAEWSDAESLAVGLRFDFVEAFKMMDLDGDGKITRVELEAVLQRIGGGKFHPPTAEEVAEMIREIDDDEDGCISLDELEKVGKVFEDPASGEEELREVFDVFDADHDGRITAQELHAVLSALGDAGCTLADCRRMIAGVDKNGDGFVCFEDFARMMVLTR